MKTRQKLHSRLSYAIVALGLFWTAQLPAGHPIWPPTPHSEGYRQANMLFLRFQDSLAAEHWQAALALCSDRVQSSAAQWQSPAAFFRDTLPLPHLLAQDFGCWSCGSNFFGLFVPLSAPETQPVIQWFWAIYLTNNTWVVDYPPSTLRD